MRSKFLLLLLAHFMFACGGSSVNWGDLPPECSIGADPKLKAGAGDNVGDSTGFKSISSCQTVTEDVVLSADLVSGGGENCLVVGKDGITIDGAGHLISGDGYAVWIEEFSNVTVRNIHSDLGAYLYGANTNGCTLINNTLSGIYVKQGDDHDIENNTLTFFQVIVDAADTKHSERLKFIGNQVEADATDPVAFYGAVNPPCPVTEFTIEGNIFINHRAGLDDVPNVMRFACSKKNVIRNNLMRGTGGAVGWYMRDDIDDSLFENNTLWTNEGEALRFAFGNGNKNPPGGNMFRNNIFRSDQGPGAWIEGISPGNEFSKNVFWGGMDLVYGPVGTLFDHNTFVSARDFVVTYDLDLDGTDLFTSNIFYGSGNQIFTFDGFDFSRYSGSHNVFWLTKGTVSFAGHPTFADWKADSASAGHPSDADSTEADPKFIDVDGGDFRLQKDSTIVSLGADASDPGAYPLSCSP